MLSRMMVFGARGCVCVSFYVVVMYVCGNLMEVFLLAEFMQGVEWSGVESLFVILIYMLFVITLVAVLDG